MQSSFYYFSDSAEASEIQDRLKQSLFSIFCFLFLFLFDLILLLLFIDQLI